MMRTYGTKKLAYILRLMAIAVLWRRRPYIFGITGSIGKTTTKDALATIMTATIPTRKSDKSYNNELGVPLTIIGAQTGGRSLWQWCIVAWRWLRAMTYDPTYPAVLVLEMGVDRQGDMAYFMGFVPVRIGVITTIASVHVEHMGTIDAIAAEKSRIITHLPRDGFAILNADDARVAQCAHHTHARVRTYSASGDRHATLYATDLHADPFAGVRFKVNTATQSIPIRLPHVMGVHIVPSILAAITAANAYGINFVTIADALQHLHMTEGRMTMRTGARGVTIIDDTYNAAPPSVRGALEALLDCAHTGRPLIAILGDMLELGDGEEREHRGLADLCCASQFFAVITVGARMRWLHEELQTRGVTSEKITHYTTADDCIADGVAQIPTDAIVLVKGSRGMTMEKIVTALLPRNVR